MLSCPIPQLLESPHFTSLAPSPGVFLGYTAQKLRKYPLTLESTRSDFLQRMVASIRGQNGLRVWACKICHPGNHHASMCGGQKIGVNGALLGPGLHRSHA